MHQKNVNLSAFLFSHKNQDVAFRMNIWQEDFRHEIFAAGKACRTFREGVFKTKNPAWFRCRISGFSWTGHYQYQAPVLLIRTRGMGGNEGLYQSTSTMICLVTSACLL